MLNIILLLSSVFALGNAWYRNDTDKQIMENLLRNLPIEKQEPDTRSSSCPLGWHNYGTRCYHYVPILAQWAEAEHYCLLLGGNLASVHSLSQHNFLLSIIQRSGGNQHTWIGGYDAIKEGLWLWSDGSRFNYQKWSPGQPDNRASLEHCMEMNFQTERGQNDNVCSLQRPFICARKQ
ncbi:hypothetical protein UPYG_G00344110 [Umbra pygmaea]|uniref:C-type lectin domain-containing protein n=1 Tax=Umbra pygmaea TaxID=75934 RepID=A0ABD0VYD7_UMBPY